MPDAERMLLEQARSGETPALEALLERYQARILRFGLKMCRDRADAEDVLQETLLAVTRSLRDFRGASSLSTWLYAIARSFCIKKRRRDRSAPQELSMDAEAAADAGRIRDGSPDPEQLLAADQLRSSLERAIAELTPGQREVLVLRDVEGLSAAEVSQVTGLHVGAVKSRLHRARREVRDKLLPLLRRPDAASTPATSCPDVVQLLSQQLEAEIGPETCAEMERHVAGCSGCRTACASLHDVLALCRRAPLPEVPVHLQDSIRLEIRKLLAQRT